MLYSQTIEDRQISFFRSMLWHVLNGEQDYKNFVDPVVKDVIALVREQKNYFTVDRDAYHTIVFLAQKDPEFFRTLDIQQLTEEDYEHINRTLMGQRQLAFA